MLKIQREYELFCKYVREIWFLCKLGKVIAHRGEVKLPQRKQYRSKVTVVWCLGRSMGIISIKFQDWVIPLECNISSEAYGDEIRRRTVHCTLSSCGISSINFHGPVLWINDLIRRRQLEYALRVVNVHLETLLRLWHWLHSRILFQKLSHISCPHSRTEKLVAVWWH